jgi:hypothetical protein
MKILLQTIIALTLVTTVHAQDADGWKTIFDGKTLTGWSPTSEANFRVEAGTIVVDSGPQGLLIHDDIYTNYEFTCEFQSAKGTNSGVFLSTQKKPKSVKDDCYELNIASADNPFPTGSLVGRKKYADAVEDDQWHAFEVKVEGSHVTVKLDGKLVLDYTAEKPSSGNQIGLQKNSGRVAFRNIKVKKLP